MKRTYWQMMCGKIAAVALGSFVVVPFVNAQLTDALTGAAEQAVKDAAKETVTEAVKSAADAAGLTNNPALIAQGEALFHDTRLSGNRQWACASCHPDNGHTNNHTYIGVNVVEDGDAKGRSTPTLWGAGMRQTFSWAGTALSLEANIKGIIVNRMKGAEPSQETLDALVAYVRSLPYPANPLLNADGTPADGAPEAAKRGHALFVGKAGCKTCHEGVAYNKQGVEDVGSGGEFKIPALRVVSQTAPYFHDGRYATLEETVQVMWQYVQKAGTTETLSDAEIKDIVEFLKIL